jgi:hypothetical protein
MRTRGMGQLLGTVETRILASAGLQLEHGLVRVEGPDARQRCIQSRTRTSAHRQALMMQPHLMPMASAHAVFGAERRSSDVAADQHSKDALTVIGVQLFTPELRVGDPLGRGKPQYRFNLWADVQCPAR